MQIVGRSAAIRSRKRAVEPVLDAAAPSPRRKRRRRAAPRAIASATSSRSLGHARRRRRAGGRPRAPTRCSRCRSARRRPQASLTARPWCSAPRSDPLGATAWRSASASGLERGLGAVMVVGALEHVDVQRHARRWSPARRRSASRFSEAMSPMRSRRNPRSTCAEGRPERSTTARASASSSGA